MTRTTFLIPENDQERAEGLRQHLRGMAGVSDVQIAHKPFDPFGADAETQAFEEAQMTVSYDPSQVRIEQIRDALRASHIHIIDVRTEN